MKVVQRVQQFTAKNKTASVLINSKYMQQFKKCSVNSVVLLDTCEKILLSYMFCAVFLQACYDFLRFPIKTLITLCCDSFYPQY